MLHGLLDGLFGDDGEKDGCREDRVEAATTGGHCEGEYKDEHRGDSEYEGDGEPDPLPPAESEGEY